MTEMSGKRWKLFLITSDVTSDVSRVNKNLIRAKPRISHVGGSPVVHGFILHVDLICKLEQIHGVHHQSSEALQH